MRLITFASLDTVEPAYRPGALLPDGDRILDLPAALSLQPTSAPVPVDPLLWWDLEGPWFEKAQQVYDSVVQGGEESRALQPTLLERNRVRLGPPVPRPGKILCIGLNYRDHAAESNMKLPERPILFSKFSTSINAPEQPIRIPPSTQQVDWEAELGVVIGRRARRVRAEEAYRHVLGYCNLNDVSARDFQFSDGQWQRGKSPDTFCPIGPFIATRDEIPEPHKLSIQARVNGQIMQNSSTDQLIFRVPELIAFLSETITLEPGDLIATGTPSGVGFARKPPVFLKEGDVVEIEVQGLGVLRNPVIREE